MNQTIVLVAAAATALLLSACGDDSGATTGQGGGSSGNGSSADGGSSAEGGGSPAGTGGGGTALEPLTLAEFFQEQDSLYCTVTLECCGKVRNRDDITDPAQCAEFSESASAVERMEEAIAEGRASFDGDAAARCIAEEVQDIGCEANFFDVFWERCPDVLTPLAGAGEPCGYSGCMAGLACVVNTDPTPRCVPTVPVGASCTGDGVHCAAGAYCDWNGSTGSGLCKAGAPDGASCVFGSECASGYCHATGAGSACGPRLVCE